MPLIKINAERNHWPKTNFHICLGDIVKGNTFSPIFYWIGMNCFNYVMHMIHILKYLNILKTASQDSLISYLWYSDERHLIINILDF